ncbi:MAG: hypothetical protein K6A32_06255, partial [Bacteroidales bacterium]|nr:hypothetical protein [Bacteroidales bacterium]
MSLTSLFAFGESFDKLWKQEQRCEDDGKPKSAYAVAEKILKKAQHAHHPGQMLCARLKMASLHQEWAPDSFFTDIQDLEAQRASAPQPEAKAVYASLLAEIYEQNRSRSQASDMVLTSDNIREWTREQYDSAATENWLLSMKDLRILSAAKSEDWIPFVRQDDQSKYFNHDLLHVLWNRAKKQNEDIWKTTRQSKAQLAKDVVEEYQRLGNREAALLVSLDYVDFQEGESVQKLLEELIHNYGDLPLCAEVYLQLMDEVYDMKQTVELGEECIRRYPHYFRIGEVRNELNDVQSAYIDVDARKYYYPDKDYQLTLAARNAKDLKIEVLRMPDNFGEERLPDDTDKAIAVIRNRGTAVSSFTHTLPVAYPWERIKDTLNWKGLQPGLYSMILSGESLGKEVVKKQISTYTTFVCTRLQPLYLNGMGKQRTIVVDAETGHPIEGTTVEFYYFNDDRKEPVATLLTDAEGRAVLDDDQVQYSGHGIRLMNAVYYGDDHYLDPNSTYFSRDERVGAEQKTTYLRLYSDRSIYRPGQIVHVGGIMFSQNHWDAKVTADIDVDLTLCDVNGKEVQKQSATTDEMGKLSADFMLPSGGLPGEYQISARFEASGNSRSSSIEFRVEEYKRPTFEVTMDKAPDMQWPADSITITGKAVGYNGVPVREGQVTGFYRFTYPWRWYSSRDSERMPIDTVTTDEDGRFNVRIPLTSISEEALWGGLMLQVEIDVLSVAGETREGLAHVPLCKKPLRLLLNVPEQQDRDRLKDITIQLLSSTGQPTDGTVEWAVYPAKEKKRASEDAVLKGRLQSVEKAVLFDIQTIQSLPVGQYEFSAKATSGEHSDSTSGYFIIFGMNDKRLPHITRKWLYCPDATFNKERPARLQIGSSLDDVAFYYSIVAGGQVVTEKMMMISDEMRVIDIPYEERFGDGAVFNYIFVKEGHVYKDEQILRLTQPDTRLKWEWTSFRDRLHPGDTETWTLRLRNPDGTPASAQVMATIYDASLDALESHHWNLFISRAYHIEPLRWSVTPYFESYFNSQRLLFSMRSYGH